MIWIAATGDACDLATFSGTPVHLIQWAKDDGLPIDGLRLRRPGEGMRRAWNLARLLTTGRHGGFQYSQAFLETLWRDHDPALRGQAVVNTYQLYPKSVIRDAAIRKWYHIDGTLRQLFDSEYTASPPPAMQRRAVALETLGYRAARGVICHSNWAADSVVRDYGVARDKVHVVVPGANFDIAAYRAFVGRADRIAQAAPGEPLRMVFVGRYWDRKGLDRLLRAMLIAQARGASLALRVIGCDRTGLPADLHDVPGVEWLGSIEKRGADAQRFFDTIAWAEIGCLLSRLEFGGMVLREFAALGLIAIAPDVCGSPDHAGPGSVLIGPDETPAGIAEHLVELATRGDRYRALRATALSRRDEALWTPADRAIVEIVTAR